MTANEHQHDDSQAGEITEGMALHAALHAIDILHDEAERSSEQKLMLSMFLAMATRAAGGRIEVSGGIDLSTVHLTTEHFGEHERHEPHGPDCRCVIELHNGEASDCGPCMVRLNALMKEPYDGNSLVVQLREAENAARNRHPERN